MARRVRRPILNPNAGDTKSVPDPLLKFDLAGNRLVYAYRQRSLRDRSGRLLREGRQADLTISGVPQVTAVIRETQRTALSIADGGKAAWKVESGPEFRQDRGIGTRDFACRLGPGALRGRREGYAGRRDRFGDDPRRRPRARNGRWILDREHGSRCRGQDGTDLGSSGRGFPGRTPDEGHPTVNHFALVDLDALKVFTPRALTAGIQAACWTTSTSSWPFRRATCCIASIARTSPSDPRCFSMATPVGLEILPDRNLAVKTQSPEIPFHVDGGL